MFGDNPCVTSLDSMPREPFPWGSITWLMNDRICPDAEQTFGVVRIDPGVSNALHSHPNCEELLYVVEGRCEHRLNEQVVTLQTGDLIRIPANTEHNAVNTGDTPVVMIVCYSASNRLTRAIE